MSSSFSQPHLIRSADSSSLAQLLAHDTIELIRQKQDENIVPTVALTGGSMGIAMLRAIRADATRTTVDWARVNFVWGDERWLPTDDVERNDRQARDALLDHIGVDPGRVYSTLASDAGSPLEDAAAVYSDVISRLGHLDLVLLGVGPDGHVASLFPGRDEISSSAEGAIAVRNSPKPPPERISLTRTTLCSAAQVWLLVSGAGKHQVFAEAFPQFLRQDAEATTTSETGSLVNLRLLPAAQILGVEQTRVYVDQGALTGSE